MSAPAYIESSASRSRPTSSTTLHVDTIRDEARLRELRPEWNALLASSRANTIFLTWEWIATWWEIYGRGSLLYVMVARDQAGRLVGVAPFHLAASRLFGLSAPDVLRFIGDGGDVTPEYLDIIARPGREREIVEAFTNGARADPAVRVMDLRPIAEHSAVRRWGLRLLDDGPGVLRCTLDSHCPVMPLPDSTEAFLAGRSRNYRKKLAEYDRRCRRDLKAHFRLTLTDDERKQDMASLGRLHHLRWNGQSRAFQSARYIEFHDKLSSRLLARGWLRLFTIETAATPLAILYCFSHGGRYYFYQAGRDPEFQSHRVGLLIMHKAILEAIKEGATVFDFLRGTEQYKYRWAQMSVSSLRLVYWRSRGAHIVGTLQEALRQLRFS